MPKSMTETKETARGRSRARASAERDDKQIGRLAGGSASAVQTQLL